MRFLLPSCRRLAALLALVAASVAAAPFATPDTASALGIAGVFAGMTPDALTSVFPDFVLDGPNRQSVLRFGRIGGKRFGDVPVLLHFSFAPDGARGSPVLTGIAFDLRPSEEADLPKVGAAQLQWLTSVLGPPFAAAGNDTIFCPSEIGREVRLFSTPRQVVVSIREPGNTSDPHRMPCGAPGTRPTPTMPVQGPDTSIPSSREKPTYFLDAAATLPAAAGRSEAAKQRIYVATREYRRLADPVLMATKLFADKDDIEKLAVEFIAMQGMPGAVQPELDGRANYFIAALQTGLVSVNNYNLQFNVADGAAHFMKCARQVRWRDCALLAEYMYEWRGDAIGAAEARKLALGATVVITNPAEELARAATQMRAALSQAWARVKIPPQDEACMAPEQIDGPTSYDDGKCLEFNYLRQGGVCTRYEQVPRRQYQNVLVNRCQRPISFVLTCPLITRTSRTPHTVAPGRYVTVSGSDCWLAKP